MELTPPKWVRKVGDEKKVIMIVYPVVKKDGSHEFLIATREGIKPNIIAQIRQNTMYEFKKEEVNKKTGAKYYSNDYEARDAFYDEVNNELENLTVDQILADPKWLKYVNPTYTSGGSKESMIIRKMSNNALKRYPKEYDNIYIANAVTNMFEDKDDSVLEPAPAAGKKTVDETIDATNKELDEKPTEDAAQDFTVDEETGEVVRGTEPLNDLNPQSADDEEETEEGYGF